MASHQKVILHHAQCWDGIGAAWAAKQHPAWRDAEVIPVTYGEPPPANVEGRAVLIVDFSYPREVLLDLSSRAASLTVIDHHKTAEESLRGLDFCIFDMNRSGAGLTWDVLFPRHPRPIVINYVEDRDLWRHDLPWTREVSAWIRTQPRTIDSFDKIVRELVAGIEDVRGRPTDIVRQGAAVLAAQQQIVDSAAQHAIGIQLLGRHGRAVNFGADGLYSEVAEKVGEGVDFGVAWAVKNDGRVLLSFRSKGDFDVSVLARQFGGGGHKHAAGARVDLATWLSVLAASSNGSDA